MKKRAFEPSGQVLPPYVSFNNVKLLIADFMCGRPLRVKVFFDVLEEGAVAVMCPAFAAAGLAAGLDGVRDARA